MSTRVFKKVQGKKVVTLNLVDICIMITLKCSCLGNKRILSSTSCSTYVARSWISSLEL